MLRKWRLNKPRKKQRMKIKGEANIYLNQLFFFIKTFICNFRDKMLCNAAYCYLQIDQPLEAVDRFNKVTEATFRSTIGLAYAYYKAKQYENSYTVYESALELLAKNEQEKALILVALASMVYAFQGDADAKTVLYQW